MKPGFELAPDMLLQTPAALKTNSRHVFRHRNIAEPTKKLAVAPKDGL